MDLLLGWLDRSTHFFDVGANYGFYSYWAVASSAQLEVFSFEPQPRHHRTLRDACDRNGLQRLHPHALALSDRSGAMVLSTSAVDSGQATLEDGTVELTDGTETVAVVRFDDWARQEGLSADGNWVAKVDVEGHEPWVLSGMRRSIGARAFVGLMVEINAHALRRSGKDARAIIDPLVGADYELVFPDMQSALAADANLNAFFQRA